MVSPSLLSYRQHNAENQKNPKNFPKFVSRIIFSIYPMIRIDPVLRVLECPVRLVREFSEMRGEVRRKFQLVALQNGGLFQKKSFFLDSVCCQKGHALLE
jgi:hypothetical protein